MAPFSKSRLGFITGRIGVAVYVGVQAFAVGFTAIVMWYLLAKTFDFSVWTTVRKMANIGLATHLSFAAVIAGLGAIGVFFRRNKITFAVAKLQLCTLVVSVVMGALWAATVFTLSSGKFKNECVDNHTDQDRRDTCNDANIIRYTVVGYLAVSVLIHLPYHPTTARLAYCAFVLRNYAALVRANGDLNQSDKTENLQFRSLRGTNSNPPTPQV